MSVRDLRSPSATTPLLQAAEPHPSAPHPTLSPVDGYDSSKRGQAHIVVFGGAASRHGQGAADGDGGAQVREEHWGDAQVPGHGSAHAGAHGPHGEVAHVGSARKTLGNVVISIVGAGVLGLPFTFRQAGWLVGSCAIAGSASLSFHCMMLLVRCRRLVAERGGAVINTYGDLGYHACGQVGQRAVDVLVLVSQGGCCVAYLIFVGENLASIVPACPTLPGTSVRTTLILLLSPLQVLLAWVRSLTGLAPFSIFADVANLLAMAMVIRDDVSSFTRPTAVYPWTGLAALPFALGVACYCYEGFAMTLPLEASMKDRTKFPLVLGGGMFCITLLYIAFGIVGYVAFQDSTQEIITLNLPRDLSTDIVKLGLCVGLFFTFPVMMHPVHEIFERRLMLTPAFQRHVQPYPRLRRFLLRSVRSLIVLAAALVAVQVPGFATFIAFVGSSVCALLAFVLPATFHLQILGSDATWGAICSDSALIAFGLAFAAYGTISLDHTTQGDQSASSAAKSCHPQRARVTVSPVLMGSASRNYFAALSSPHASDGDCTPPLSPPREPAASSRDVDAPVSAGSPPAVPRSVEPAVLAGGPSSSATGHGGGERGKDGGDARQDDDSDWRVVGDTSGARNAGGGAATPPEVAAVAASEARAAQAVEVKLRRPLIWVDLEMTGLDVQRDHILEIACVVTDGDLNQRFEGPDLAVHQSEQVLAGMNEWCQHHHHASGLVERVRSSTVTLAEAEQKVLAFVRRYSKEGLASLAGNSIYVDLMFLQKHMPRLAAHFSHVLVDVSSVRALAQRWYPRAAGSAPRKEQRHRALEDINETINELKHFRATIFKQPRTSKHA
ncbi:unnamed protein product [Closterium sp. NIES-53]